jgi:hypothetical protein
MGDVQCCAILSNTPEEVVTLEMGADSSSVSYPPIDSLLISVGLVQLEIPTTRCSALLMQPVVWHECRRVAICVLSANF